MIVVDNGSEMKIFPLDELTPTFSGPRENFEDLSMVGLGMPAGQVSLAEGWEAFKRATIPDGASETQIRDMQRTFYAGIGWFCTMLGQSSGDDATDEAFMESIDNELLEFATTIVRDKV